MPRSYFIIRKILVRRHDLNVRLESEDAPVLGKEVQIEVVRRFVWLFAG